MFRLVHAGFDTIDVAFQGALPPAAIPILQAARDDAAARQEAAFVRLGPGQLAMHIAGSGMRGGYAFVGDTGPLGAKWFFKANSDPREWNIFASPRASALAAKGYHAVRDDLFAQLRTMGCLFSDHSINRVDFAMDFATAGFELHHEQFVAHSHTKLSPHWSEQTTPIDRNQPSAVIRGRRLESVTIGKMPGRQIIVYDKRREAIEKQKPFWFRVWGIDRNDPAAEVWRVEIRAGKKEIKERWNIRHFEDLESRIGDACKHAIDTVRYLADQQTDGNISRQRLHPLWLAASEALDRSLTDYRSGMAPEQLIEIEQELVQQRYRKMVLGNAAGLAAAIGMDDDDIETELPTLLAEEVKAAINQQNGGFQESVRRARERLRFVAPNG